MLKLTTIQYSVLKVLRSGGALRATVSITGTRRFKLLDAGKNPIKYVQRRTVDKLNDAGRITKDATLPDYVYLKFPRVRKKPVTDCQQ